MAFTLRNLKDLEDLGSRFDGGAPDLEFRLATEALALDSHLRLPEMPHRLAP